MLLRQVIELFDLLDTPAANGTTVTLYYCIFNFAIN